MTRRIVLTLLVLFAVSCAKKAEVTWDTPLYDDAKKKTDTIIPKGTVVTAYNYRNHDTSWSARKLIHIRTEKGTTGYIDARKLVIGQDPSKSVFKWGYRKDYKPFYSPKDKKRYKKGYRYSDEPQKKIPLDKLLKLGKEGQ